MPETPRATPIGCIRDLRASAPNMHLVKVSSWCWNVVEPAAFSAGGRRRRAAATGVGGHRVLPTGGTNGCLTGGHHRKPAVAANDRSPFGD